ncbi:hypothetical protein [Xenophilus azovorans]|uniref:hypothetical protein n=1 Tax=Xenophilus azovorans TaxID=151755 RepID=UPI00056F9B41|nr:hypothetical protein [Xenophilus azovorans]
MNELTRDKAKAVRLVFELERAENPRLYDELMRFPQGVKRVNRLRVLAYDGLLAQHGVFSFAAAVPVTAPAREDAVPRAATVTNEVFGPGLAE